jgi:hypothetical protein
MERSGSIIVTPPLMASFEHAGIWAAACRSLYQPGPKPRLNGNSIKARLILAESAVPDEGPLPKLNLKGVDWVNLISFVELELRMDLIPYDLLKADFGADAAILADFSGLYIDGEIFDRMLPAMDAQYGRHAWVANAEIRSKTAELIAPRFGVHPIAIETRFDREGIWPSPF